MNNLALIYMTSGRVDESLALYSQLLPLAERIYGGNHSYLANILINQGNLFKQTGELEKAEQYLTRALSIHQQVSLSSIYIFRI